MNDDLGDRLDAVEDAAERDRPEMTYRIEWVGADAPLGEDGNPHREVTITTGDAVGGDR